VSEAGGGRVVLVTGGSRGIGAACASWFATHGDRVAATTRGDAQELKPPDGVPEEQFMGLRCDVTDPTQVEDAFCAVEERWGAVEVLVANAGITRDTLVVRMGEDAWHDVIETNLTGAFRVAKRAVTKMLRLHRGRVVFVSSVGAFVGLPGQANYAASKAGLVGMARALAREVASRQITVNVVAPGVIETDMTGALGETRVGEMVAMVPLGRVGSADDVAAAVGFLASDAAAYISGAVLAVDGGLGMGL
jgi:3-oxoacyl-[acyl-carrier protein] reductase